MKFSYSVVAYVKFSMKLCITGQKHYTLCSDILECTKAIQKGCHSIKGIRHFL